jgi:hypothetical protein
MVKKSSVHWPTREEFLKSSSLKTLKALKQKRIGDISFYTLSILFGLFYFFYGYKLVEDYMTKYKLVQVIARYGLLLLGIDFCRGLARAVGYYQDIDNEIKLRLNN